MIKKILHIAANIGGGVGDTLLGYISESKKRGNYEHDIAIFGYAMEGVSNRAFELDVKLWAHMDKDHELLLQMIPNYDVILMHVWNHPLLYDFLVRNVLPPCRLVMWGHNSGLFAPNIYTKKILTYPDMFVFTTPLSYNIPEVVASKDKSRFYNIWSNNGTDKFKNVEPEEHEGFNIGYVGTVDYAKLNPNFLEMCKRINIKDVRFIVVGGTKHEEIKEEAKKMGLEDKMIFTGWVSYEELLDIMKTFDLFGYPLAPHHYGTCDLTLQMAMACGVVPVVLNNPMESFMVKHLKTGLVSKDLQSYIRSIEFLYMFPEITKTLAKNAKEFAISEYSLEKLEKEWNYVLDNVLKRPKLSREWDIALVDIEPHDVFLESLGRYGEAFYQDNESKIKELARDNSWQTETKGSVHNYNSYFPDDTYLSKWSKIMGNAK